MHLSGSESQEKHHQYIFVVICDWGVSNDSEWQILLQMAFGQELYINYLL